MASGARYIPFLVQKYLETNGKSDLIAFFFRAAFALINRQGTVGLIATNTIAQGDTRAAGLRFIANNGGTIYNVQRRLKWPGSAAVVVSVVHFARVKVSRLMLDERPVGYISAFLAQTPRTRSYCLSRNSDLSFQGSNIDGQGFVFSEEDE